MKKTAALPVHSELGASGMYRWDPCPGSVRLSAGLPNSSSSYAAEGTVAHAIGAECLQSGTRFAPENRIGEVVEQDGHAIEITAELIEAVQVYLDTVNADIDAAEGQTQSFVEKRFHLKEIHEDLYGTNDAAAIFYAERLLRVYDYKHGAGKPVEVKDNKQLKYYALGALLETKAPVDWVEIVIVQPRCGHPEGPVRRQRFEAIDLVEFSADLLAAVKRTKDPKAPLNPGDHCQWCPAAAANKCPALDGRRNELAAMVFKTDLAYNPAQLSAGLDAAVILEAQISAMREFAYAEAVAGRVPPGWKLVDKRPSRQWKNILEAELILCGEVGADVVYEPRALLSPAKLEKVLTQRKMKPAEREALLDPLVEKISSGTTLVHESDKRESVKRDAASVFAANPMLEAK